MYVCIPYLYNQLISNEYVHMFINPYYKLDILLVCTNITTALINDGMYWLACPTVSTAARKRQCVCLCVVEHTAMGHSVCQQQ